MLVVFAFAIRGHPVILWELKHSARRVRVQGPTAAKAVCGCVLPMCHAQYLSLGRDSVQVGILSRCREDTWQPHEMTRRLRFIVHAIEISTSCGRHQGRVSFRPFGIAHPYLDKVLLGHADSSLGTKPKPCFGLPYIYADLYRWQAHSCKPPATERGHLVLGSLVLRITVSWIVKEYVGE